MGSGQSAYVQKQEEFVRANRDNFKKELKGYNTYQVEGKLRQLYAGTDNHKENKWSYISPDNWEKARSKIIINKPRDIYIY